MANFSGPDTDRLALRELVDSYGAAVMKRDAAAWGACWAPDAVWRFKAAKFEGRSQIVERWEAAMAGFRAVSFTTFPGSIHVDGDHASLECHTIEHLYPVDGPVRFQTGLYRDRAVRTAEGWKFQERTFEPQFNIEG